MALTRKNPRSILLSGAEGSVLDNTLAAGAAITPGYLIEPYLDTTLKWRKTASATAMQPMVVADKQTEQNKGIDDDYAAGDLVQARSIPVLGVIYGIIASGQNVALGDYLGPAADGTLAEPADADAGDNLARFMSLDAPGSVTVETRVTAMRIA